MRFQRESLIRFALTLALATGCAAVGGESETDDAHGASTPDDERASDAPDTLALHERLPWPWGRWWRPRGADAGVGNDGCSRARCEGAAERAQRDLARWQVPVTTCCRSRSACGVQASASEATRPAARALMQSLVDLGCSEPSTFTVTTSSFAGIADAMVEGPEVVVKDGRIDLPEGGRIVLDPSCPDLVGDMGFVAFTYPGCCDASGQCGNSNHTLRGLPQAGEPHRCLTWDELIHQQSEFIPVPDAPTACRGSGRSTP